MTFSQFVGIDRLPWWNTLLGVAWALLAAFWWRHNDQPRLVYCTACAGLQLGRAMPDRPSGAAFPGTNHTPLANSEYFGEPEAQ